MSNKNIKGYVSNLRRLQREIKNLEANYHKSKLNILEKRLNSKSRRNNLTTNIKEKAKTESELQKLVNACAEDENAIKSQINQLTQSLSKLQADESSFKATLQKIDANIKQLNNNMEPLKREAKNLEVRLGIRKNAPTPFNLGKNNRESGPTPTPSPTPPPTPSPTPLGKNNRRSGPTPTPSPTPLGKNNRGPKIAAAFKTAWSQKQANHRRAEFRNIMQFNREKKKNLPKVRTTNGRVRTYVRAIEAAEALREKRNRNQVPVGTPTSSISRNNKGSSVTNMSQPLQNWTSRNSAMAQLQRNANESLKRLKERKGASYANVASTPGRSQPAPAPTPTPPTRIPRESAINKMRGVVSNDVLVAPTRRNQTEQGKSGSSGAHKELIRGLNIKARPPLNQTSSVSQRIPRFSSVSQGTPRTSSGSQRTSVSRPRSSSGSVISTSSSVSRPRNAWRNVGRNTAASLARQRPPINQSEILRKREGTGGGGGKTRPQSARRPPVSRQNTRRAYSVPSSPKTPRTAGGRRPVLRDGFFK